MKNLERLIQSPVVIMLGLVGGVCSIIAIPISLFSIYLSINDPQLTYQYDKEDYTKVLNKINLSGLHIFHDEQEGEIDDVLSILKIKIWNAGRRAIKKEDIRENLVLQSKPEIKILEVRNLSQDSPVFKIIDYKKANGSIGLEFEIIENNEGDTLQIVYLGDSEVKFNLHGKLVGQGSFKKWDISLPGGKILSWFFLIFGVVLALSIVLQILIFIYSKVKKIVIEETVYLNKFKKLCNKSLEYSAIVITVVVGFLIFWSSIASKFLEPF